MKINLIIPMAGHGSRFLNAGYNIYKPFLKLSNNKTMIRNICDMFPKNVNKFFIVNKLITRQNLNKLRKIENSKIIKIKPHKLGPIETIIRAEPILNGLENIFVSYCDITWKWNFQNIDLKKNKVFCFKGWHPFTKDNNNYAFCKINKFENLIKIKEKSSFTKFWQKEPLSIGLFFFLNAKTMFDSFKKVKKNKIKINSEYFPSLGFNYINNSKVDYVEQFVHIGNPQYFEEFKNWNSFFKYQNSFKKKIKKTIISDEYLLPAAGESKRFKKENIFISKFLIKLGNKNKRVIEYINDFLPSKKKNLIILKNNKYKKLINKNFFNLYLLKNKTNGQASTIFKILPHIVENKSLFINSCDVFSIFDIDKFLKLKKKADIILFVSGKSFQNLPDNNYTWVENKKDNLIDIYIKKKPKKNLKILTGNFYFRDKMIYSECYKKAYQTTKKNEIYIDDLVKESLKLNYNVKVLEDNYYINFGTPSLIKDFNFWEKYFI